MLTVGQMREKLKNSLSEHRYAHSLGVMETAVKLAAVFGADEEKARVSGLVHDCAKPLSTEEMLLVIRQYGIDLYPGEEKYPHLLHAPAGAAVARRDYGIEDEEILSAIRRHTVGGKDMTALEAIVFVSDFIEPNRQLFDGLEDVRRLAGRDIYAAVKACKELTREYCLARGQSVFTI